MIKIRFKLALKGAVVGFIDSHNWDSNAYIYPSDQHDFHLDQITIFLN